MRPKAFTKASCRIQAQQLLALSRCQSQAPKWLSPIAGIWRLSQPPSTAVKVLLPIVQSGTRLIDYRWAERSVGMCNVSCESKAQVFCVSVSVLPHYHHVRSSRHLEVILVLSETSLCLVEAVQIHSHQKTDCDQYAVIVDILARHWAVESYHQEKLQQPSQPVTSGVILLVPAWSSSIQKVLSKPRQQQALYCHPYPLDAPPVPHLRFTCNPCAEDQQYLTWVHSQFPRLVPGSAADSLGGEPLSPAWAEGLAEEPPSQKGCHAKIHLQGLTGGVVLSCALPQLPGSCQAPAGSIASGCHPRSRRPSSARHYGILQHIDMHFASTLVVLQDLVVKAHHEIRRFCHSVNEHSVQGYRIS